MAATSKLSGVGACGYEAATLTMSGLTAEPSRYSFRATLVQSPVDPQ